MKNQKQSLDFFCKNRHKFACEYKEQLIIPSLNAKAFLTIKSYSLPQ